MNRARIKEQSKQVAEYMKKPQKYQVLWDCPHCGNSHTWWWEDEFEAFWEGEAHMVCDRCDERVKCVGDGHGYYAPVKDESGLSSTTERLERQVKDLYDAVNALSKRLTNVETGDIFDGVSRKMTPTELAIAALRDCESAKSKPQKQPSILDIIHGVKPPFHERFREGCGFTEETLPGEDIAKMLRFIAVEVERMTERDMGGSYTISNLTVGEKLRALAYEAEWSDEDPDNPALAEDGN